jgi:ribonuclease HI
MSDLDILESKSETLLRRRAWAPIGMCKEAVELPERVGGLGLGRLRDTVDGEIVNLAWTLLESPGTLAGRLFAIRLRWWQYKIATPFQPLERVGTALVAQDENKAVAFSGVNNPTATKYFHIAVGLAAQRLGVTCMKAQHLPWMNTRMRTDAVNNFTPLCDVLELSVWRAHRKWMTVNDVAYVGDMVCGNGHTLRWYTATAASNTLLHALQALMPDGRLNLGQTCASDWTAPTHIAKPACEIYCGGSAMSGSPPPPPREAVLYTDGSTDRSLGEATAGFGVKGGGTDRGRACRLAGAQNNHKAELLAINAALTMVPSYGEGTESIRIYSDSQASIKTINAWRAHEPAGRRRIRTPCGEIVADTVGEIRRRESEGQIIRIDHVKAHTGKTDPHSLGNAAADQLANEGRGLPTARAGTDFTRHYNTVVLGEDGKRLEHDAKTLARAVTTAEGLMKRNQHKQGAGFLSLCPNEPALLSHPTLDPVSDLERHVERNAQQLRPSKSKIRQSELPPNLVWPRWRAGGRRAFIASYASMPTNSYLHMIHCSPTTRCACGFAEGTNKHQLRECVLFLKERATLNAAYARAMARLMAQRAAEPAAVNKGALTRAIKGIAALQGSPTIINLLPPDVAELMGQRPPHQALIRNTYEQIFAEQAAFITAAWPLRRAPQHVADQP